MPNYILAIDQGTTSTRAVVFDAHGQEVAAARREFSQHYPNPGWVEHDAEDIWRDTQTVTREALATAGLRPQAIAAIGITNQRETCLLWDRLTGEPVHHAIVWQDRRTASFCAELKAAGHEPAAQEKTGLLLDPYFSATKLRWLLDLPGIRARATRGELAFGTIDTFLLWRLTQGRTHATDATNASRTLLFNIHDNHWDPELLRLFDVPEAVLPDVRDSAADYGHTTLLGPPIPIRGVAGDQQAALVGQACFRPGEVKSTYGTGCFALANTGPDAPASANRLLTTIAYRLDSRTTYALEGSIFVAGAAVKWLRDSLGLIAHAADTDGLATSVPDNGGVYLVPAFVGLGAPHWRPDARATLSGMTLATSAAHVARAALESVVYQTADLFDAMVSDGAPAAAVRVDGGMAANDWFCQFLADVLDRPVDRPADLESTARGAALLAGLGPVWPDLPALAALPRDMTRFNPRLPAAGRAQLMAGWRKALERTLL